MKYYAYLVQDGEGCDYTIGCGRTMIEFDANDDQHAEEVLAELIEEEGYTGERQLSKATIFKEPISFDTRTLYSKLKEKKLSDKARLQHIKDMEDFEKLKKKLGK